jgi:hypothetical protein
MPAEIGNGTRHLLFTFEGAKSKYNPDETFIC